MAKFITINTEGPTNFLTISEPVQLHLQKKSDQNQLPTMELSGIHMQSGGVLELSTSSNEAIEFDSVLFTGAAIIYKSSANRFKIKEIKSKTTTGAYLGYLNDRDDIFKITSDDNSSITIIYDNGDYVMIVGDADGSLKIEWNY